MFDSLIDRGFQVEFLSHAKAILGADFPTAVTELENAIAETTIPIEEIIAGGGGEAKGTQRLRRALTAKRWVKTTFVIEKRINGIPRESQSHEVDHVREFEDGSRIALKTSGTTRIPSMIGT
jgi:hypothetical protein